MYTGTLKCTNSKIVGNTKIDQTSHIILPSKELKKLVFLGKFDSAKESLFFLVENKKKGAIACANVIEFSAPDDQVILPAWLFEYLDCQENDIINITQSDFPQCTSVVLQPLTPSAPEIDNVDKLSSSMRNYLCLNQGSTITLSISNNVYQYLVLKTEPKEQVKTLDCDFEVEFAPPQ